MVTAHGEAVSGHVDAVTGLIVEINSSGAMVSTFAPRATFVDVPVRRLHRLVMGLDVAPTRLGAEGRGLAREISGLDCMVRAQDGTSSGFAFADSALDSVVRRLDCVVRRFDFVVRRLDCVVRRLGHVVRALARVAT